MTTENQPQGTPGANSPPRHDASPAGSYQDRANTRDPRDPRDGGVSRFLGGSPLGVAFRLIMLSILVGVVLAVIGLDPWNIVYSVRRLFWAIWDLGFGAIDSLWRYFLLGAVIVIPIWLISRMVNAPKGR